jgi:hypothetical protein
MAMAPFSVTAAGGSGLKGRESPAGGLETIYGSSGRFANQTLDNIYKSYL